MNGNCTTCELEPQCGYPYKPCDCANYRKFRPIVATDQQDESSRINANMLRMVDTAMLATTNIRPTITRQQLGEIITAALAEYDGSFGTGHADRATAPASAPNEQLALILQSEQNFFDRFGHSEVAKLIYSDLVKLSNGCLSPKPKESFTLYRHHAMQDLDWTHR